MLPGQRGNMPERRDPLQPSTRDVAARGARIRFVEAGRGPPLVLVHDCLASRLEWDDVLERLSQRFHVVAPDLPGFGESEKPAPGRYGYDFDAFAESLVDLSAALGLVRLSLCGRGLGGAVALTLAAEHAHLVEKMVLVNPLVYPPRPDALTRLAGIPVVGPLVFKQILGRTLFRNHLLSQGRPLTDGAPDRRLDHFFDLFDAPAAREAAYVTMRATLDTRPLMARVPRVTTPTLLLWGRRNRTGPVEQGRRLARELSGCRFEVLDCGPSPAEECPDAFADALMAFLSDSEGD
jgi:pimeloyl-ACP methyl ester carboxylesterase